MELNLDHKIALVTGASKGIGLAITAALAHEGAHVVAAARTETAELAALCAGHPVEFVAADLATPAGPAELLDVLGTRHGGLDILVNNVGAGEPAADTIAFTDEQWQRIMDVTFYSAVRTIRAAVPLLRTPGAAIVNIGSLNASLPSGMIAPYSAAKAALRNVGKALAEDLGPRGIRVNTISPGPVRTPMWTDDGGFAEVFAEQAGVTPQEVLDRVLPESMAITLGRIAEPDEIADLALFLCSSRSRYITGADHVIDGGMLKSA